MNIKDQAYCWGCEHEIDNFNVVNNWDIIVYIARANNVGYTTYGNTKYIFGDGYGNGIGNGYGMGYEE